MRRCWTVALLFVVVASSGCATAYAQSGRASYVGRWAEIPAKQCRDSAYQFTTRGVETGMEGSCRFDQIRGGSGRWHITMTCRGEGGSHREQWEILVNGNSLQIKSPGEAPTKLTRCP
jgi:hypothetical protein